MNQNQDLEEIIKIYRIVQENDTSYIIMEYVEGITLQDYLDDGEGIGREMAEDFIRELAGIVDAIHSRGIIHYHLSPKNIYLDNLGRIRILDFGDAKKEIYRILGPDINILDLRYTAPEVLQREKAGAGADLYSLGAIGYRLLTGKEPPLSRPRRKKKTGLKADTSEVGQAIEKLTTPIIQKRPESAVQALLSNGSREEKQYG